MERYYDDDEDNKDEEKEPFFGDGEDDEEIAAFIDQQDLISVMQMDVEQVKLNQELLEKAIKIAKNSWFWSFHSAVYKMDQIEHIYRRMVKMTAEDNTGTDDDDDEEINPKDFQEIEKIL